MAFSVHGFRNGASPLFVSAGEGNSSPPVRNLVFFFLEPRGLAGALVLAKGETNFSHGQKFTSSSACAQDVLLHWQFGSLGQKCLQPYAVPSGFRKMR